MRRSGWFYLMGAMGGATAFAPVLAAQGGGQARGRAPIAAETPTAPAERPGLEPAREILRTLVGTWRFELRLAGNYHGAPDASGTRVFAALYDDLRLEWSEELDRSSLRGQGVLGFDPATNRFFSTAVYSAGAAPELLSGVLDAAAPVVTFSPIAPPTAPGHGVARPAALSMITHDHFVWTAADAGWRAVFTRQP